jgi:hypothetical protein
MSVPRNETVVVCLLTNVCSWWKSGRAVEITAMTNFDPYSDISGPHLLRCTGLSAMFVILGPRGREFITLLGSTAVAPDRASRVRYFGNT